MGEVIIRASALPAWPDCNRRTAAQLFRSTILAAGFSLHEPRNNAGNTVGTALHTAAAEILRGKIEGKSVAVFDAVEPAFADMRERIENGILWDDLTGSRDTAEKQVLRMTGVFAVQLVPIMKPIAVEEELKADLGGGYKLRGRKDSLCREPTSLDDLKSGKLRRISAAQYGAYTLLERTHHPEWAPQVIREHFIQRVALGKAQPIAVTDEMPVEPAETEAMSIIGEMKDAHEKFMGYLAGSTRPPESAFRPNPRSMLCSEKYCTAFNTDFCRVHQGAK